MKPELTSIIRAKPYRLGWIAAAILVAAAAAAAAGPLLERYLNRKSVGQQVQAAAARTLNAEIAYQSVQASLFWRPRLRIAQIRLAVPNRFSAEVPALDLIPSLLPLLWGELRFHRIELQDPAGELHLAAAEAGDGRGLAGAAAALAAVLKGLPTAAPDLAIRLQNGSFRIFQADRPVLRFRDIAARLDLADYTFRVSSTANVWDRLRLEGRLDPCGFKSRGELRLRGFRPHLLLRPFVRLKGLQIERSEADLTASWRTDGRQHQQVHLTGRLPHMTLVRGGRAVDLAADSLDLRFQHSGEGLQATLNRLSLTDPELSLAGDCRLAAAAPFAGRLRLESNGGDVRGVRQKIMALAEDNRIVSQVFRILQGGHAPQAALEIRFGALADILDFKHMHITGRLEKATVWVPGADLLLKGVSGEADIADQILKGRDLAAHLNTSTARQGTLTVGLGGETRPFELDVQVYADLADLPPVLQRIAPGAQFRAALSGLEAVEGKADGRLTAAGTLAAFTVGAEVSEFNLHLTHKRLPDPLQIDRGGFRYRHHGIDLAGLQGRIGGLRFEDLALSLDWTAAPTLMLKAAAAGVRLHPLWGWLQRRGWLPAGFQLQKLDGAADLTDLALQGPLYDPGRWRFRAGGRVAELHLQAAGWEGSLSARGVDFSVTQDEVRIPAAEIAAADAVLQGRGSFQKPWAGWNAFDLHLQGRVGAQANQQLLRRLGLPEALTLRAHTLKSLSVQRKPDGAAVSAEAQLKLDAGPDIAVALNWHPDGIEIHRLAIHDDASDAEVSYRSVGHAIDAGFSGNLARSTLDRLYSDNRMLHGWIEGDWRAHIDAADPLSSSFQGRLRGEGIDLQDFLPAALSLASFDVQAGRQTVHVQDARILVDGSPVDLKGGVNFTPQHVSLEMEATTGPLEYRKMAALFGSRSGFRTRMEVPLEGVILLNAESLAIRDFVWTPCHATVLIRDGRVHATIEEAAVCGVSTPGRLTLGDGDLQLGFELQADGRQLESTLDCLLPNPVRLDGTYRLRGRLAGEGRPSEMLAVLAGDFDFSAQKGRIHRLEALSKIFSLLNVTEIFAGRLPDFRTEGLPYDTAAVKGRVDSGRIRFQELVIDGPTMKLIGEGSIALQSGTIDMTMLVAPLKTIDRLVDKVPLINKILGGSLVSIPVKIKGDLKEPQVIPLGPGAIGTRLLEIMKNTTQLPFEIMRPILPADPSKQQDVP